MLHDLAYLDAAFDQPSDEAAAPRMLVLCTTPRSGSHRLGRALFDLGLGVQEEYLHPKVMRILGRRWVIDVDPQSADSLRAYWSQLCRWRARGGFVALSIFGSHLNILKRFIPPSDQPVFVHLYRHSAADQVASLLTLMQTKTPYHREYRDHESEDIPNISEISPRSIDLIHRYVALQNRKWRHFLADKRHLSISSEAFFARPTEVLQAIVAQCDIEVSMARIASAAETVGQSGAYSINAQVKQQMLRDHAASFAALGEKDDGC